MKSVITKIAIFAIGVGVGVLAVKKYYKDLAEDEIESVKEHYGKNKRFEPKDSTACAESKKMKEDPDTIDRKKKRNVTNPLTRSSADENDYKKAKKNYNSMSLHPVDEEEMNPPNTDKTQPYLIDSEEFADTFDNHEKVCLYYYRIDDVLTEENEEVLMDRENVVGFEAIKELDIEPTVWVRNERLDIDYEIMALNKSYQETVHGIDMEDNLSPRERYMKKGKGKENLDE